MDDIDEILVTTKLVGAVIVAKPKAVDFKVEYDFISSYDLKGVDAEAPRPKLMWEYQVKDQFMIAPPNMGQNEAPIEDEINAVTQTPKYLDFLVQAQPKFSQSYVDRNFQRFNFVNFVQNK